MTTAPPVQPGQVWADNDPRAKGRTVRVLHLETRDRWRRLVTDPERQAKPTHARCVVLSAPAYRDDGVGRQVSDPAGPLSAHALRLPAGLGGTSMSAGATAAATACAEALAPLRAILQRWPPQHDSTCRKRRLRIEDIQTSIHDGEYVVPCSCGLSEALENVGIDCSTDLC
ncbi:MAG TPA: hypothetical protein VD930_13830 [Gemmatimonadales bacterium]|nr:hypothetical protein [Gemmatimonadales bacterium]